MLQYLTKNSPKLLAAKDAMGKLPADYVTDQGLKSTLKPSLN